MRRKKHNLIGKADSKFQTLTYKVPENKKSIHKLPTNPTTQLADINTRIAKEICYDTINALTDKFLINDYRANKLVQNEINKLEEILDKHNIVPNMKEFIYNEFISELIPCGVKRSVRGITFNTIVKKNINSFNLDTERFEIRFEHQCQLCITSEKPDWYILEKLTGRLIIGMNQTDLFGGGRQIKRGYKYLIDNKQNTDKIKLLCVVCNHIKFSSTKTKPYKIFAHGYKYDSLCYIKNLENIINSYFK